MRGPQIPVLETKRLLLRPLELADAAQVQDSFPCWEVVRYMAAHVPWPYPEDGALSFIRDIALPAMQNGREWHWSIRLKDSPEQIIGIISLMSREDENRGFWLHPSHWGTGLMREASNRVTDFWFDELGKAVMRIPKASGNAASRAISERSQMRVVWRGERDYVSGRHPAELWEITAHEWRAYRSGPT